MPAYTFVPPAGEAADADRLAHGQKLFAAACAECHGGDGAGGGAGRLNDPNFLLLVSDQMLRRIIITGRPDLGMPNFATKDGRAHDFQSLSSADIDDLVALLASWRGPHAGEPGPPEAAMSGRKMNAAMSGHTMNAAMSDRKTNGATRGSAAGRRSLSEAQR